LPFSHSEFWESFVCCLQERSGQSDLMWGKYGLEKRGCDASIVIFGLPFARRCLFWIAWWMALETRGLPYRPIRAVYCSGMNGLCYSPGAIVSFRLFCAKPKGRYEPLRLAKFKDNQ
jgi:hypothetical protein